jgi:hypothetical protein
MVIFHLNFSFAQVCEASILLDDTNDIKGENKECFSESQVS